MLNFALQKPEKARGLPPYSGPINWDALNLIVDTADGSPLEKRLMRARFFKAIKKHGIESLTPEWRVRYVTARLSLGDFSEYWGWEFRGYGKQEEGGFWAASLYWEETWLPKWGGGYVDRLLILGEQGVGDQIFWASIIPEAMCRVKQVVYECDDRLHSLLERSLPGLICDKIVDFEKRRPADAFIPGGELMRMFRRDVGHFPGKPYLKPDPARIPEMSRFAERIGLAWRARQGSIDPNEFGIKFIDNPVSLQYKDSHPRVEEPGIDLWGDIEGIVALCAVLKKVITVPMTVHHLAGAQGVPVDMIGPSIEGEKNQIKFDSLAWAGKTLPWYPSVRVWKNVETWRNAQCE